MKVCTVLVVSALLVAFSSKAQESRHFHVPSLPEQECVKLTLNAASVNCRMSSSHKSDAVSVYGQLGDEMTSPVEDHGMIDKVHVVNLDFENAVSRDFRTSISGQVFSRFSPESPYRSPWRVYLSTRTSYELHLDYGMGTSTVDLSGLSVEKVKINTGSAAVKVGYTTNVPNQVAMDTFYTQVDLGVLELDRLNLSRARQVIADVGFGKMIMRFTEAGNYQSDIAASVGAGTLKILLEDATLPIIVRINNSPLCRVKMIKSFRKIRQNTFISESYSEEAEGLLSFDIDVSMGYVEFAATP